jgi:hypothetical protein
MKKKETQELIAEVMDIQVDRQIQRIQGSVGGSLKGQGAIPSVLGLDRSNIMQLIISLFANKQNKNINSSSSSELFKKN